MQAAHLEMPANLIRQLMRRIRTLPRKGKQAADLTEGEKLALCIAAGAPTEAIIEYGGMIVRTTVPCGIADRGDGGWVVTVCDAPSAEPDCDGTA